MIVILYCCGCRALVHPRLTDGKEIYPHREDLFEIPFWKCDDCGNFVGCHHKTRDRLRPLGSIPTPQLRKIRSGLHRKIDPTWRNLKFCSRTRLYSLISKHLGEEYHIANVNSADHAEDVLTAFRAALKDLTDKVDQL